MNVTILQNVDTETLLEWGRTAVNKTAHPTDNKVRRNGALAGEMIAKVLQQRGFKEYAENGGRVFSQTGLVAR